MALLCTLGGCSLRPLSTKILEKRTCTLAEAEEVCAALPGCKGFGYTPEEGSGYAAADKASQPVDVRFFGTQLVCSWFGGSQNLCFRVNAVEDHLPIIEGVCESKGRVLHHANTSPWLSAHRELMMAAVRKQPGLLTHVAPELRRDREVALAAIGETTPEGLGAMEDINEKLWNDTKFVESMIKKDGLILRRASEQLQADRETVLIAVRQNGEALLYSSKKLKNDREVVKAAVDQRGESFKLASEELRADLDFVKELVRSRGAIILSYASDKLRSDPTVILPLVRGEERLLEYASDSLRQDKAFITEIVEQQGDAIRHAWHTLWEDPDLILLAAKQNKNAIRHAGKSAWNNKEFVMRMVGESWKNLDRCSAEMCNDRDVAKIAVKQSPDALQYLSNALKEDSEIVFLVYQQDEDTAVRYARSEVFAERDFCFAVAGKTVPTEWGYEVKAAAGA